MCSKMNQLYMYIHPLFFGFPSHLGHHRALNRVLCDMSLSAAAAAAKLLQSWLTLCNPRDGSPPGSPVPGIEHWSGLPFPSPMHESEK